MWSNKTELDILATYNYNWFELRNDLAYRKGGESDADYETKLAAMERMLMFRETVVGKSKNKPDGLLGKTIQAIEAKYRKMDPPLEVKACAFGSIAPTSDYDITFAIPNYKVRCF